MIEDQHTRRDRRLVEDKMLHLGFRIAAETLRDRWQDYTPKEQLVIKQKWGVV